jgi:hypothetical protein
LHRSSGARGWRGGDWGRGVRQGVAHGSSLG